MDTIFYEAQRQGRISFYSTTYGEEAINIASAAALSADDLVLPQHREPGVLLWRGFTLQDFANQCFGIKADSGKARQMPIHYVSKNHNYFAVSSPMATQLPQAVGVAFSLKMDGKNACVATYFGDGGSSEEDFHADLNFAAVLEAPVVFICRNNRWAISTPTEEQFRSDGLVVRGRTYGIRSIRVDGNDALAAYSAIHAAREMATRERRPILVEALTYRVGDHSTSDDSTKYRPLNEIRYWKSARTLQIDSENGQKRRAGRVTKLILSFKAASESRYCKQFKLQRKQRNLHLQTCSLMSAIIHHQTFKSRRNYLEKPSRDIRKATHLMFLFRKCLKSYHENLNYKV